MAKNSGVTTSKIVFCDLMCDYSNFAKAEAVLTNQEGEIVLTGDLQGFLPNLEEQKRLSELLDR